MTKFADLLATVSDETKRSIVAAGIQSLDDVVKATRTPALRSQFAKTHDLGESNVYQLAKQADLLRIVGMDITTVHRLVGTGVRSSDDLVVGDVATLLNGLISTYPDDVDLFTAKEIRKWQTNAKRLDTAIEPDVEESVLRAQTIVKPEKQDVFFSDMTELIVNLGMSIADAQRVLDENSILTQEMINEDDELRAYGINATWYVIPEADVNLKMNYTVTKESSTSGESRRKILISPLNARYQNYFKSTQATESALNLKIRPLPAPSRVADIIIVPNVIGLSKADAVDRLVETNLLADVDENINANAIVTNQTPSGGDEARFRDRIQLIFEQ